MTKKEKMEYAYLLFSKENNTLKQIAEKVGVSVNTVSRWKKAEKWEELRKTLLTSRLEQLRRLYMQLDELNTHIMGKEEGKRFANKAEADTLTQLTRSIQNLEKEMTAAEVINIFIPFIQYVSKIDGEKAKLIVELQDSYIKSIMR